MLMPVAIALHNLAAVIWVGGMLMMLWVVRPAAAELLEPPLRGPFLCLTLQRFFPWVWLAVGVQLVSGYWMLFAVFGGMGAAGLHVHIMQLLGLAMMVVFSWVFFAPFQRLKAAVASGEAAQAGACLQRIRFWVRINASLGVAVVLIATGGRYL
ncbi:CopD family protein [Motiliproteus sp. SC1-56]|uniref:CopD family protein n=1 Tax=Motiliproteus sp. SC1-56 TaxID=2799565 RepID=UPI001F5CFAB1|nr:CopD family protein [Motiliproteus sp. SC1-56]